jgi:hypothetical protein
MMYYAFFGTAVNRVLIEAALLDQAIGPIIGLVVETGCSYFERIAFPENVEIGFDVSVIGRASASWESRNNPIRAEDFWASCPASSQASKRKTREVCAWMAGAGPGSSPAMTRR